MIDDRRAVRRRRVVQAVRAVFVPSRRVGAALDEREERADVAGDGGGARVVVGAHRGKRGGERARVWTTRARRRFARFSLTLTTTTGRRRRTREEERRRERSDASVGDGGGGRARGDHGGVIARGDGGEDGGRRRGARVGGFAVERSTSERSTSGGDF